MQVVRIILWTQTYIRVELKLRPKKLQHCVSIFFCTFNRSETALELEGIYYTQQTVLKRMISFMWRLKTGFFWDYMYEFRVYQIIPRKKARRMLSSFPLNFRRAHFISSRCSFLLLRPLRAMRKGHPGAFHARAVTMGGQGRREKATADVT